MPIHVYDYQHDITNLAVHPEIRARFPRMERGPPGGLHSHDLGGEIFLVLEGHCEFLVGMSESPAPPAHRGRRHHDRRL